MENVKKFEKKSAKLNAAKKRANHLRNVQTRAALYSEYSHAGWMLEGSAKVNKWHETLNALSMGTA